MFSKPFKVKSNSQLKGSERKKIRIEILKHFPKLTEDDLQVLIPPKEVMTSRRIYTNSGESVIVYSVTKYPIIFEMKKIMYPTVFMMWQFPDVIPTFSTWPQVLPKIVGGADLMLPGVVFNSAKLEYGQLKKGDRMAVNLTTNKAAVGVGEAALDSDDMYMAARRGKAVKIIHHIGDHLWSLGTEKTMPELGPPKNLENLPKYENEDFLDSTSQSLEKCELTQSCDTIPEKIDDIAITPSVDCLSLIEVKESGKCEIDMINEQRAEMDETVLFCFFKALKNLPKAAQSPLLVSTFYKAYMIPACPSYKTLDLKKSSHKKLSKFLAAMQDQGVLVVQEVTKGVDSIVSINLCHPLVRGFVDTESIAQVEIPPTDESPKVTEMYNVTAAVLPLFSGFSYRKGTLLSGPDVRKYVTIYVKNHRLQNANDRRQVILDDVLRKASGLTTVQCLWPDLFSGVMGAMTRSLQLVSSHARQTDGLGLLVANNSKVEPIDIQVGSRSGNKKVTLVYNLEMFGINLSEFAHTCKHGVAASTSIGPAPNRKGQQLLIQGNQVHFVGRLLQDKYEISKQYIRGLEKAVKPKN